MVAVGDQQLRAVERALDRIDRGGVRDAPQAVESAVIVSGFPPRFGCGVRGERRPSGAVGVGEQGEDRRQVRLGRAREPQTVLSRTRMRALVRPDPAGAIVLHAHAREEAAALAAPAVGAGVILLECPECRRRVGRDHALPAPVGQQAAGLGIGIVAHREVDAHDVVGGASLELGTLRGVDHVVRRRHHRLQSSGLLEVVVERPQRFDLGHGGRAYSTGHSGRDPGRRGRTAHGTTGH